jgi:hypothetical protein
MNPRITKGQIIFAVLAFTFLIGVTIFAALTV